MYVMLDDDPLENCEDVEPQVMLPDAVQERIRGLEEKVELLKTQLDLEAGWTRGWRKSVAKSAPGASG